MQASHLFKKSTWALTVVLCVIVGLYPIVYFIVDRRFGLLSSKTPLLLADTGWNIGFYVHIVAGGLALLAGWTQFPPGFRNKNRLLHRQLGKLYVLAVLLSASAGMYISIFATGGWIARYGFFCLGAVWFYTTWMAYRHIKNRQIDEHRQMMTYSYAACFAAVTLRIWLPVLTMLIGDSLIAYRLVAWLCWIPNLVAAHFIIKKSSFQP